MRNILIIISIAAGMAIFHSGAPAFGAIETRTEASWEVGRGGDIVVSLTIGNDGNETAYDVDATMFLGERTFYRGALGANPPGEEIRLEFLVESSLTKAGTYTALIRIRFEEQTGASHRIYHPLAVVYSPGTSRSTLPPIEVETIDPVFNPRTFWGNADPLPVTLINRGDAPLDVRIAAWVPDGFSVDPESVTTTLPPGVEVPVRLKTALAGASRSAAYYLTIDAETARHHHSVLLRGHLAVEPKPIYFKIYLVLAAAGALLLIVWMIFRSR